MTPMFAVLLVAAAFVVINCQPSNPPTKCASIVIGQASPFVHTKQAVIPYGQQTGNIALNDVCSEQSAIGAVVEACDYDVAPELVPKSGVTSVDIIRQGSCNGAAIVNATIYCTYPDN